MNPEIRESCRLSLDSHLPLNIPKYIFAEKDIGWRVACQNSPSAILQIYAPKVIFKSVTVPDHNGQVDLRS